MKHLIPDSPYCDRTLRPYLYNLTSSYSDLRNDPTKVATSIGMLFLAATLFIANLFSGYSDLSASLNPSMRSILSTALFLFGSVMSYLFSEAKDKGDPASQMTELPLRARMILMWMLLVELLRHKVVAIRIASGMQGYSAIIERAGQIGWLGYLVFVNLRTTGKRALYGILWVLAAAKLVQRFAAMEVGKRSYAYGKNPMFLVTYMAQKLTRSQESDDVPFFVEGDSLVKRCNYIVMGEDELMATYGLDQLDKAIHDNKVVTVGKIWQLDEANELLASDPRLKTLCLSFALYKLLRPRLDREYGFSPDDTVYCHSLFFRGLCQGEEMVTEASSVTLFQVVKDELNFLSEYYHSVHPVVFASPFFFLANYILYPIIVFTSCILMIILCGNGEVLYAFRSFRTDNYGITVGLTRSTGCILSKVTKSSPNLFATIDICISILLGLTFIYGEVWEFTLFLVSNWFKVSLLYTYASSPHWRYSLLRRRAVRTVLFMRNMLNQPNICFKQFSVLSFWLPWPRRASCVVPDEAKKSIMERLASVSDVAPISNGRSVLLSHRDLFPSHELSWACESFAIAEVILTWHIATALLEARHPLPEPGSDRKVATALSRYCTYLVIFCPELLPALKQSTESVYEHMNWELKKEMGLWRYYCSPPRARYDKLMEIAGRLEAQEAEEMTTLTKGAKLGKILIQKCERNEDSGIVWKLLADVWTEIMIYAALPLPLTLGEKLVEAHKEALENGVEFITMIWAMALHTGLSHKPVATAATQPASV